MNVGFYFSVFAAFVCLISCEDDCGSPPEIDQTVFSDVSDSNYVLGTTVTYRCDHGYVGIAKTSRCVKDTETDEPVWTDPEIACNPRSCADPGIVENARRKGSRFTFPNNVEYTCNEGYRLRGTARRYCEASGVWSGRSPTCMVISCRRPGDPENGRAVFTSLEYNSELTYKCNKGLQVSSKEARICGPDGEWTSTEPICKETECEIPQKPEFGSVELVGGKPKVGSIAIYNCDPGRKILGSVNSKCGNTGEWSVPTPLCIEPCTAPAVANGELGKYVEEYKWGRWRTVFRKVREGSTLDEDEMMILKCDENYVPSAQPLRELSVYCRRGQLSPEPKCATTSCEKDPPPIQNGRAVVNYRNHGHVIWYKCDQGFDKFGVGNVQCWFGSWNGNPPSCVDTRCNREDLNYPGLVRSNGFLYNGQSFEPTCLSGYDVTESSDKRIRCEEGKWVGNLPPCTVGLCKTEDLLGFSGLVLPGDRTLDEGEFLQPACAEGFELSNKNDSKLYCREGAWRGTIPPCTPAHCLNNPPVPKNGRIKSIRAVGHGSVIQYECSTLFEMVGEGKVVCNHGQWTGSLPQCKDTRCYLRNLPEKDGVDLTNDGPINSHSKAQVVCITGYRLKYPDVYCELGEWKMQNALSPCQENGCVIREILDGDILKERTERIKNIWGTVVGTKTVRESASIGSSETSGNSLYVECNGRYKFQGSESGQVEIICRRGEWTPFPVCELPGTRMEAEIPTVDEAVSVPLTLAPTPQLPPQLRDKNKINLDTGGNKWIPATEPSAANVSGEIDFDDSPVTLDSNSTDLEQLAVTEAVTESPCSCRYTARDGVLIAYDGKKIIRHGDEILSGSILGFYCNTTGFYRLQGHPSLQCPADCQWDPSLFPSCVAPGDNDIVIRVFAQPPENMQVGPGGVLAVIPTTKLELTCRVKTGYSESVDWTIPEGANGYKQPVRASSNYRIHYVVPRASGRASGKYTCYKTNGPFHSVDIEVKEPVCPEIDLTGDVAVSYSPNRNFGSRATFHCFSPYQRNGPSYVTCEASGMWSGPPASCELPTCPMETINDLIPQGVVPLIEGEISETVPYGYVMKLGCDESGTVLKGINTAICGTEGKWSAGRNLQCVKGCASPQREDGTDLLVFPKKEIYNMGESITFSCPAGKTLTEDVERIMCFKDGWTPNIVPDCQ